MFKKFSAREWLIAAACGFGIAGLLIVWFMSGHLPEIALTMSLSAVIAYAAVGALMWTFLHRKNFEMSVWRGIAAGLGVSLLALPVFWLVLVVINFILRAPMPIFGYIVGPIEGILLLPSFALLAWTTVGWASGALCALTGGVLAYLQVRSLREPAAKSRAAQILNGVGIILLIGVILLGVTGCFPVSLNGLGSQSQPVADYAGAIAALEKIRAREETLSLVPVCKTQWLTHDQKTDKVIVFFHGLSNCPEQFNPLGQQFFERGYNVLIARFPEHVDISRDPAHMRPTAEQFRAMTDEAIDIAQGLGEHVYVMGLSGGAGVASWVAQERSDVERVVSIAPFYGLGLLPSWLNPWAMNVLTRLPNIPARSSASPVPYQYLGMSSMGVGETMRFAAVASQDAARQPIKAGSFLLILNDNDVVVSNSMALRIFEQRRALGGNVELFTLGKEYGLPHDIIDPHQRAGNVEFVYPLLIDLTEGRIPTLR